MWFLLLAAAVAIPVLIVIYFFRLAVVRTRKASFPQLMPDNELFREHLQVMASDREWVLSQPQEKVSIRSFDGLRLRGRLLMDGSEKRIILLVHGYRTMALWDFPSVVRFYRDQGLGVLLIDQRACGESQGRYICFGALERYDVQRWLKYLYNRFPKASLYMDGVSMGSTTVMLALGLDLPPTVRGAIADCGFTTPLAIMRHVQKTTFAYSGGWILSGVRLLLRIFARYDPAGCSTLDALKVTKIPILFLHGDADRFVPVEMTLANYEACASEKRLLIVPGAGHGESYVWDREGCEKAILAFFEAH
jgi:pimeloyl-ACP methyl ester carboxylesterase